ncbi:hypothetical protein [Puia sp.]|jgi:hypothetical protein|uniref:hypothetical protein n=1 Tax=Puia sp. TaxID=2045100 RepID=UPI002F3FF86B
MKSLIRLSHYIPAASLVIFIVTSCNKNGGTGNNSNQDSTKAAATVTANLTAKPWKYDTSGLDTNNDGKIDQGGDTTVVPICERDDLYTFNTDNTGSLNTGSQHCTVGEAQTISFIWTLSSDNKTLKATGNPILQSGVTIQTLDSAHLSVYRDSTLLGVTYRYIVSLKH